MSMQIIGSTTIVGLKPLLLYVGVSLSAIGNANIKLVTDIIIQNSCNKLYWLLSGNGVVYSKY